MKIFRESRCLFATHDRPSSVRRQRAQLVGFCGWVGTMGLIGESDDAFTRTVSAGECGREDIYVSNVAGWASSSERSVRPARHAT